MAKEYVYFARGKESGRIKIGWTKQLWRRLAHIQAHSGEAIELLAHIADEDMRPTEQGLHKKFKVARIHGEWFSPAPELLEAIAAMRGQMPTDLAWYDAMQAIFINDPVTV